MLKQYKSSRELKHIVTLLTKLAEETKELKIELKAININTKPTTIEV